MVLGIGLNLNTEHLETIGSIIKAQVGHIPEERREMLIVKPLEKDDL